MARGSRIPKYAVPIARSIALKIKAICAKRKLSKEEAASQLGVKIGHFVYLARGRQIPGPVLARRLLEWAADPSYRAPGPLSEAHYGLERKGVWKKVRFEVPFQEYEVFRKASVRMGMSMSQFAYFAMRQLASNAPAIATIERALQEYAWTRTVQAVQEAPELRDFLEYDLDLVSDLVEPKEQELEKPSIQRLLELPTEKIVVAELESEIEEYE